jgi:hypothetical protein
MMRKTVQALLLIFTLMGWNAAFAQRQIETIGLAAPPAGQPASSARQLAISDAMRNAIEVGVGVFITAETSVQFSELLEDKIYKKTQGFARLDKILSEGPTTSGTYQIRALVTVDGRAIATSLRSIIRGFNDPRIAVIIGETVEGEREWKGAATSIAIAKALAEVGFRVIDQRQIEQNVGREELLAILDSPRALAQLGTRLKVDLILYGTARATRFHNAILDRNKLIAFQGVVELSLVDVLTAQTIWPNSFEGLNYDGTLENAANATFKLIGTDSAKALVSKLTELMQGGGCNAVYLVKVSGFRNFLSFNTFLQKLAATTGVNNVQSRDFDTSGTLIEVEFCGKTEELAIILENLELEVVAITGRELRARAK